jgi:hypothetical protein
VRSSRLLSSLSLAVVLLLVGDGLAVYQLAVRNQRPPSFRRGGEFRRASALPPTPATLPSTTVTAPGTSGPSPTTTAPAAAADPGPGRAGRPTSYAPAAPVTGRAAAPSAPGAGRSPTPALGTYVWTVHGTEGATGFGSRSFPERMTMVAHRDGADARAVTLDLTFSSDHSEREVVGFRDDGVGFDFEGGQVRFGPMAQTNQGDYRPPLVQIPFPLAVGTTRKGTSQALDDGGGAQRTEDWKATVVGQETITVAGTPTPTWRVDVHRASRPGSGQQVERSRTYWWDPARSLWVRVTEQMHGQQHYGGITFTYDARYTAELASFTPS